MSLTLRGRVETRLAAALVPLAVAALWAAVISRAWPVMLAALMIGVGIVLDVLVWDRLDYQPGWAAVPIGGVELVLVMAAARALRVHAPLPPAVAFFAAAWVLAQLFTHALLPLARLTYAEDGGELRKEALPLAAIVLVAAAAGVARAAQPPAVLLSGTHGRLVVTRPETIVGDGAVVRGGILVRADDVTIRNISVVGGDNGIDVERARNVRLERVRVAGARLDGIHVRDATVIVRDCVVETGSLNGQGIDISFAMAAGMSAVRGCRIVGGRDGIVTHVAMVEVHGNHVTATRGRAIAITEMSLGTVASNRVGGALGVGILCSDSSECRIERNVVAPVRPDLASGDLTRMGYGIEAHYNALAHLRGNRAARVRAFLGSEIRRG